VRGIRRPGWRSPGEVKSHSSIDRFLVVSHSPGRIAETGLPIHRSEKTKAFREGRTRESILSSAVREEKFANWRAFREDFNELRREFASVQTAWRSRQSGANLSLPKFPANREFNREFLKIVPSKTALSFSNLHILQEKHIFCSSPSREFSELYQGIKRTDQGFDGTDQGIWN
jgi:hypothetical protein